MQRLVFLVGSLAFVACSRSNPEAPPAANSANDAGPIAPRAGSDAGSTAPVAGASGTAAPHAGGGAGMAAGAPAQAGRSAAGSGGAAGAAGLAAGSGGGTPSAGSGGSSGSAAPAACPGVFCEDFESGQLDTKVWTRTMLSAGNTATVQTAQVAHGKYAMQFHAKGGSRYSLILHDGLPESLHEHYFGRMYAYATGFPTESGGHTAYITSSNGFSGFPDADHHLEVASYTQSSGPIWQLTYWSGNGPEYIGTGGKIPTGKWFCLEWEFNDAPDEIAVWVDGNAMQGAAFRNINNHSMNLVGKLSALGLGFRTWHPMGAPDIDLYMDDVVLGTQRIGCL